MIWSELKGCIQGSLIQQGDVTDDLQVEHLLTDSRLLRSPYGTLFFAIKGKQNGHDYIQGLYRKGVRFFVVEEDFPCHEIPQAAVIRTENSIKALQSVAAKQRLNHSIRTIGITGSNGKTTVKEWLARLLSPSFHIVKTPKSYNSQIGVPLSVWNINNHHEIGIFEAGISKSDEMKQLERIIQPEIGIFTNIGSAHADGFESTRHKVEEKSSLFDKCDHIICCKDYPDVYEVLHEKHQSKLIDWSTRDRSARVFVATENKTLSFSFEGKDFAFTLPFEFEIWRENAIHVILASLVLGLDQAAVQEGLNQLKPVAMRLSVKKGINDCYLIDDTYNNDLHGLEVALDFTRRQQQRSRKTLILSELIDAGLDDGSLYQQVAQLVSTNEIDRTILIGRRIIPYKDLFGEQTLAFEHTEAFLTNMPDFREEMILVKGARVYAFEQIVRRLEEKSHVTRLEVSFESIVHNLNQYRALLAPKIKIMAMVKAFAYGGGSAEIANLLQFHNIDYLGVAYTDEAIALRKNGIKTPIMVMNSETFSLESLAGHQIEPEVFSMDQLLQLAKIDRPPAIHLKIETGMNRLGFRSTEWEQVAELLKTNPQIRVAGVFTHLSSSDDPEEDAYSHAQVSKYKEAYDMIAEFIGYRPLRHVVNSSGMVRFPEYHFDMVRLGIGLYGFDPSGRLDLVEVNRLTTYVTQIKELEAGESIGYGRSGRVDRKTRIAIVPIGYADGFDRRNSKGAGQMVWKGHRIPTIGNVCMDMTMLLIGDLDIKEGDEIEVFGDEISIREIAERMGTIPYEVLTSVSQRVKRVYLSE